MPYIPKKDRDKWKIIIDEILKLTKDTPTDQLDGELNYLITSILHRTHSPSYFNYNRTIGLLECIKSEFYRRRVSPYEEKKIKENGDVG